MSCKDFEYLIIYYIYNMNSHNLNSENLEKSLYASNKAALQL